MRPRVASGGKGAVRKRLSAGRNAPGRGVRLPRRGRKQPIAGVLPARGPRGHLRRRTGRARRREATHPARTAAARACRPGSSDTLIESLWIGSAPSTAQKIVQVYISGLRKALGDERIVTRPRGYELVVAPGE